MNKVKVNRSVMLGLGTGGRVLKLGEATLTDEEMALPATKRYIDSGIIKLLSKKPKQGKLDYSGIPRIMQTPQGPKVIAPVVEETENEESNEKPEPSAQITETVEAESEAVGVKVVKDPAKKTKLKRL